MRERILFILISLLFVMLITGLFFTQILSFPYYSKLSRDNSIRIIPIDGPRGNIFDRNNAVVVTNRLSFDAAIVYQGLGDRTRLARVLKDTLGMSGSEISDVLEKSSARSYAPFTIAEDISKEKALILEEASCDVSGLVIQTRSKRNYVYGSAAGHISGYLGEVTEEELENLKDYGYRMKDLVGRDGLEKYYDSFLAGSDGGTQIEVDSRGRQTRVLGLKEPKDGKDLFLTIDMPLQLACDKLLGEHRGAVIAMNPSTGEILALASHPAFDPNIFVRPDTSEQRVGLMKDRVGRPLSNRAISGLYPPGSVFKVVTAAAALETKKITSWTSYICSGSYKIGNGKLDCWKKEGHGSQNLRAGLMNSCNVFFCNIGRVAGVDAIEMYARVFGFGAPSGIDLPDEVKGLVPGKQWKKTYRKASWYEGETLNYSIGQGYLLVTPIQVLDMMSVIANNGSRVRPYLVRRIGTKDIINEKPKNTGLHIDNIKRIREGLYAAVNDENGTAKRAKTEGVTVLGKTGTAQNPHGKTHAWFAGFAPDEKAKICVVVFLEHGGKGGLEPAEIARGVFTEAKNKGYL